MFSSSYTISLYNLPPPSQRRPSAFAVSMVVHVAVLGIGYAQLKLMPHVAPANDARTTVRMLDLHRPALQRQRFEQRGAMSAALAAMASNARAGGALGSMPQVANKLRNRGAAQTLLQPDLAKTVTLPQDFPIPAALLWRAANAQVARLSPPEKLDTTSTTSPSLRAPSQEPNLYDVRMTDTGFHSDKLALPTSTTSPVVAPTPHMMEKAPEMWSLSSKPASATIISISDLQMEKGTITVPSINEVAGSGDNTPSPVRGSGSKAPGQGESNSESAGTFANMGHSPAGLHTASDGAAGNGLTGNGTADETAVTHIELPKNGKFGVVVVGSSLAEQYPETLGVWEGRIAYTVYVHAGSARNWILQYSLPRAADAAAGGEPVRPEAPWPYNILVPRSALSGLNTDALLIRGVVNSAGRFEQLSVVAPEVFPQQASMLNALQEWRFRPASQNGHATAVDVLLIIPEVAE